MKISTYSPRQLSSTFSSPVIFSNLRTITVSDYYLTQNYIQLMKFFGWTWIAAAFADDNTGQSGRYSFAQFSDSGLYFPCSYIIGTQTEAGLSALSTCIQNYTDIKVLLIWGSAGTVTTALSYLYEKTNLTYLTFVINPSAASSINFNLFTVPLSFYQGSIFLSENYDQEAGYSECIDRFLNDPALLPEVARVIYEKEYNCVLSTDTSIPLCLSREPEEADGKCRCLIGAHSYVSKPYTVRRTIQDLSLISMFAFFCSNLQSFIETFCKHMLWASTGSCIIVHPSRGTTATLTASPENN